MNDKLSCQVALSDVEKNNFLKTIDELEIKLKISYTKLDELSNKLENMKKSDKILNLGTSKLDEISAIGRIDKEHHGLRLYWY